MMTRVEALTWLGSYCWYCGREYDSAFITEHKTPRSRGGGDGAPNLVTACWSCNVIKGARTLEEYRSLLAERSNTPAAVVFFGESEAYRVIEKQALDILGHSE